MLRRKKKVKRNFPFRCMSQFSRMQIPLWTCPARPSNSDECVVISGSALGAARHTQSFRKFNLFPLSRRTEPGTGNCTIVANFLYFPNSIFGWLFFNFSLFYRGAVWNSFFFSATVLGYKGMQKRFNPFEFLQVLKSVRMGRINLIILVLCCRLYLKVKGC